MTEFAFFFNFQFQVLLQMGEKNLVFPHIVKPLLQFPVSNQALFSTSLKGQREEGQPVMCHNHMIKCHISVLLHALVIF